jgi:DNA-binding MarR family transcriptional regulator
MDSVAIGTSDQIVSVIRCIIRSFDLHSRSLVQSHGLTGPQATLLKALSNGPLTAGDLASRINLSQGTVTDVMSRLEKRGLVERVRDQSDRRRVIVSLTEAGTAIVQGSLPLARTHFAERLAQLPEWEQSQLLSALQRVAHMMDGELPPQPATGRHPDEFGEIPLTPS